MLSLNIGPICKASGVAHPYPWLRSHGFSHNAAHMIMSGRYRQPPLNTIEKLCLLFNCVPNDLLEWAPDDEQQAGAALAALLPKNEKAFDWVQDLDRLSPDTLRALGEKLKEMQGDEKG